MPYLPKLEKESHTLKQGIGYDIKSLYLLASHTGIRFYFICLSVVC